MSTIFKQVKNNAKSIVNNNALNNTTTTLSFDVENGSSFPTTGNSFYVTVWDVKKYFDPSDDPKMRIGLCTVRSGNTLTITWGQLGTPVLAIKGRPVIALLVLDQNLIDAYLAINSIENRQDAIPTIYVGTDGDNGYKTDGTADNVQLQAALDAVHAKGRGKVFINSPITLATTVTLYPDVVVEGLYDRTTISIASNFSGGVVLREQSGAANGLTVRNIKLSLSGKVDVGGIHIYQGNDVVLDNVWVDGQGFSSSSKWTVRVGNYTSGSPDGTASYGTIIKDLKITNCNSGTFEQLLFVNQVNGYVDHPYFENNTNSLAYELTLYINNKNVVVDSPHFENPNANSIAIQQSDGIFINDVTATYDSNFALITVINSQNTVVDGVIGTNSTASPTTPIVNFFDRAVGPDGFTQIVPTSNNISFKNFKTSGWRTIANAQIGGTVLGTTYTMNQYDILFSDIVANSLGAVPFQIGVDDASNALHDWDFRDITIKSWTGVNTGAFQLRGYSSVPTQMYNFRFNRCTIPSSGGGGSNAAIRAISMVVESVDNCKFTGTFSGYGALSAVTNGSFKSVRSLPQVLNVSDFGAKADGTTDDAVAIKAALDTANTLGFGVVQLMPGVHAVASSITGSYKNIVLRGYPGASVLKAAASYSNGIINLDAASSFVSNVTVEGVTFDCNSQTNVIGTSIKGGTFASGAYAKDITFRNCIFKNLGTVDIGHVTIYTGRGTTDRGPVSGIKMVDCDFQDTVKYHVYINGGQLTDFRIADTRFSNSQYGCIAYNQQNKTNSAVAAARSHKEWRIQNCRFVNNHLSATPLGSQIGLIHDVNKTGVRSLKIQNNYFGASQSTVTHYVLNLHSMLGLEIEDNEFDQCRTAMSLGQSNNGPYFQEDGSREVTIRNNRFYRCYNIADLDSTFFANWQGNKFTECTYGGLTPYSRQFPSIYDGNIFYNTPTDIAGTTVQRSAFSVVPNGSVIKNNVIIDDRLLTDPTTAPVLSQVSGGSQGARTYYVVYTWENDTGETLKSAEASFSVSANNLLRVTHPYSGTYGVPTGAKKVNWYVSTSTGTETKQDFTPTPWQQEYEVLKTTFGALSWTEPTTGLIAGAALPSTNTTQTVMLNGIYEVSGGTGTLLPNFYENNKFFGNFNPISKQSTYKRVQKNNYHNQDITSTGLKLVESIPYVGGSATGAVTFDTVNGEVQTFTLTGNVTATMVAGQYVGQRLERRITNSGSFTYTKASNEKLAGGTITITGLTTLTQGWDGTSWNEVSRQVNLS